MSTPDIKITKSRDGTTLSTTVDDVLYKVTICERWPGIFDVALKTLLFAVWWNRKTGGALNAST